MVLLTNKLIKDLLPSALQGLNEAHLTRVDLLQKAWPEIIGERFASMTRVASFERGALTVHVNNGALYSLLVQHEKERLLYHLRQRFPGHKIRYLSFRMGE